MASNDALDELRQTFAPAGGPTGRRHPRIPRGPQASDAVVELKAIMGQPRQEPLTPQYPSTLSLVPGALRDTFRAPSEPPRRTMTPAEEFVAPIGEAIMGEPQLPEAIGGEPGSVRRLAGTMAGGVEKGFGIAFSPLTGLGRLAEQMTEQASRLSGNEAASTFFSRFVGEAVPLVAQMLPFVKKPPAFTPEPGTTRFIHEPIQALPGRVGPQRELPLPPPRPAPQPPTLPSDVPEFWPSERLGLPPAAREPKALSGSVYRTPLPPPRTGEGVLGPRYPTKRPYEPPVTPTEIEAKPVEGEVLDRFGRPVPPEEVPPPTMTERERLRAMHRTPLGGPPRPEPLPEPPPVTPAIPPRPSEPPLAPPRPGEVRTGAQTEPTMPPAPAEFLGWQEAATGQPPVPLYNLTQPVKGRPVGDTVSAETLRGMGYEPPEPSIASPGGRTATQASNLEPPATGQTRILHTPEGEPIARLRNVAGQGRGYGTWEIEEWIEGPGAKRPLPFGQQGTYGDYFRARVSDRLLYSKTGEVSRSGAKHGYLQTASADAKYLAEPEPPPKFERTAIGDQSLIPGAEARAIPTRKTQARVAQAPPEGLFEQPPSAGQETLPGVADRPTPIRWRETRGQGAFSSYKSEDGRFRVDQLDPDTWRVQDNQARDIQARFTSFQDARKWAQGRAETPAEPPTASRGQHYGKTVDTGTADLTNPEDVRMLVRDRGGIRPTPDLDRQAVPKDFLKPGGVAWDEFVQEIADAQGKRPKDVERALNHTLSRYDTMRQEMKGAMGEVRGAKPPEDIGVSLEEWQGMSPSDRQGAIEWFRDVFRDESGRIDLGAMVDSWKKNWKKLRQRFPMEGEVRKVTPDSPALAAIERFDTFTADWMARFTQTPVYKALQAMKPSELMDLDERMTQGFQAGTTTKLGAGPGVPAHVQGYLRFRDRRLQNVDQAARQYFGLDPIPETAGPYLPRVTKRDARESVSLGGGTLGLGRDIQTTVRGHQQERLFESYRQGERAGTEYEDPRNAILLREWESTKLDATHRLFRELEQKGVLFRDKAAATAANARVPKRTGGPWRVEQAPGGEWWARTEEEAKLLEQNLTEPRRGTNLVSSFVHYANSFIRTPGLFNPAPHLTKNMGYKYLLQRGPVGAGELGVKVVEYARGSNPTRLAEFREAMPFSESGRTAADILHTELRQGTVRDAIKGIERAATFASRKLSQPAVFQYGDPAMRYALFDYYRRQGRGVYEAGNNAWQDLVRYGTRSWMTDEWKSLPMNFFVPWRYGTVASLLKATKNHPVRTALTVGAIEYLREIRYRQSGRWTHLPIDYVEKPIALVAQERNPADLPAVIGTMAAFGPGGDFTASNIRDLLGTLESGSGRGLQDPDTRRRLRNMFWAISQAYEIPTEIKKGIDTGDPSHYVNAFTSAVLAEHDALNARPRRLMRDLPEWLPGMQRAPKVQYAEQLQERKRERSQKYQERRQRHPTKSIQERVEDAGYR